MYLLASAEFRLPLVDGIITRFRCLRGDPVPVLAFIKPQAIVVVVLVGGAATLVDGCAVGFLVRHAVLVPVVVFADLEKCHHSGGWAPCLQLA